MRQTVGQMVYGTLWSTVCYQGQRPIYRWWFPEIGVPPNHPYKWDVHYKPTIFGYPHLWKSPGDKPDDFPMKMVDLGDDIQNPRYRTVGCPDALSNTVGSRLDFYDLNLKYVVNARMKQQQSRIPKFRQPSSCIEQILGIYPLVIWYIAMEAMAHRNRWFTYHKWWFSMANC